MIDSYKFLVFVHILLLVFWLGTDVGVFTGAWWMKKRGRPFGERVLLLQIAGFLDVMPRLCSALMMPVGLTLARERFDLEVGSAVLGGIWAIALVWCVAIVTAYRKEGTPVAHGIARVQRAGLAVAAALAIGWGAMLLAGGDVPGWLAAKVLLFGFIYLASIGIDLTFTPAIQVFLTMPPEGGNDAQEAAFSAAINRCCAVVLLLYAILLASTWLGVFKAAAT
ncbi:MAG: hypothetical protein KA224_01510 [Steroidobacteraceae bacterium]|nr:hypothetical protein [Steroidobacteraceae bacterium]MCC7200818.1 hypothetical protein [Gammaproteobacteria bacterium]